MIIQGDIMSKHIDFMGNSFEHLGPYDCFFNAVVYWLEYHKISIEPLYTFNWNISYHSPTEIVSGSVYPHMIFDFLYEYMQVDMRVYELEELNEIPLNTLFILESNSYFFENELDYYQKADHTKYVVAKRVDLNKLLIWDPYDNETILTPISNLYTRGEFNIYGFFLYQTAKKTNTLIPRPYLLERDYAIEYMLICNQIKSKIIVIKNSVQDNLHIKNNYMFRKYYGCFRGIYMIRERHFRNNSMNEHQKEILSGWNRVQKNMIKFGMNVKNSEKHVMDSLENVFEKESLYLNSYK